MSAPAIVQHVLEQLRQPQIDAVQEGPDLRWAHRIMDRYRRGETVKSATLEMARLALKEKSK